MRIVCPTCAGKGSISDPKVSTTIGYVGPNGESSPQVICQTCNGEGWVDVDEERFFDFIFKKQMCHGNCSG